MSSSNNNSPFTNEEIEQFNSSFNNLIADFFNSQLGAQIEVIRNIKKVVEDEKTSFEGKGYSLESLEPLLAKLEELENSAVQNAGIESEIFVSKIQKIIQETTDIRLSSINSEELEGILTKYLRLTTIQKLMLSSKSIFDTSIGTIQRFSSMSEKFHELDQQLKSFNTESQILRAELEKYEKVTETYQKRVDDHIGNINNLASKESVTSLTDELKDFKTNFGSSDAGTGFANTVTQSFSELRTDLEAKVNSESNELKKLIRGPNLDGQGGLENQITEVRTDLGDTSSGPLSTQIGKVRTDLKADLGDTTNGPLSTQIAQVRTDLARNATTKELIIGLLITIGVGIIGSAAATFASASWVINNRVESVESDIAEIQGKITNIESQLEKISEKLGIEIPSESQPNESGL